MKNNFSLRSKFLFFSICLFCFLSCKKNENESNLNESDPKFGAAPRADSVMYVSEGGGSQIYAMYANTGTKKWTFKVPKEHDNTKQFFAGLTIADQVLYQGGANGYFYAINAKDGTIKWSRKIGINRITSPATVSDGVVYFGCEDRKLYALNIADGSEKWKFTAGDKISYTNPLVSNGVVYFGCSDKKVYAVNAVGGTQKWSYSTNAVVFSSPTIANGIVYVGGNDGYTHAINADNGSLVWKKEMGSATFVSPIAENGMVYMVSATGVFAFDAANGSEKWKFDKPCVYFSSPTVAQGVLYYGTDLENGPNGGVVYALDAMTGAKKWEFLPEPNKNINFKCSPTVHWRNGFAPIVYINSSATLGQDCRTYALDANTGEKIWITSFGLVSPPYAVAAVFPNSPGFTTAYAGVSGNKQ